MPFFIAVALLVVISSVYLLHQYWTHALVTDEPAPADTSPQAIDPSVTTLRAA